MTSKILVADDSITIQKIVAMAFENEDATVEGVSNGKDAFDKLKKFKPDIVLADVEMPGLNGFELSRKIKESAELSSISVLLLASDFEEFEEDLLNIETYTPKIEISTPKVYQSYRENFYAPIDGFERERLKNMNSLEALATMSVDEANDLFKPALQEYKHLKDYYKHGYYFSGSGSSFFRVIEDRK